jgi:ribosome-associated protein
VIRITESLAIPEGELEFDFIRSSGPGGQKVNRTASAVQLRFNVSDSPSLPRPVKQRLRQRARTRINSDGVLVIEAKSERTQQANRRQAIERLVQLVRRAANPPKPRKRSSPPKWANERRLVRKKRRGQKKRNRKYDPRRDA